MTKTNSASGKGTASKKAAPKKKRTVEEMINVNQHPSGVDRWTSAGYAGGGITFLDTKKPDKKKK